MKDNTCFRAGFTLIEIMIVVAIIGLLATIAIPNINRARENAYQKACINNLRQLEGAVQVWALDTKKSTDQAVSYQDVSGYLKNSVVCPAGGTSFADSYSLSTVDERPTCLRKPGSHKLPL